MIVRDLCGMIIWPVLRISFREEQRARRKSRNQSRNSRKDEKRRRNRIKRRARKDMHNTWMHDG